MLQTSNLLYPSFAATPDEPFDTNAAHNMYCAAAQRADDDNRKRFLPPGSGQSRFAPPSYYYPASKSGVTPSWVIDELHRARSMSLNS